MDEAERRGQLETGAGTVSSRASEMEAEHRMKGADRALK